MASPLPKTRPRWMRYRLRTLFILAVPVAVCMWWYVERVKPQQMTVAAIEAAGGQFFYDTLIPSGSVRDWVAEKLGSDFVYDVVLVSLPNEDKSTAPADGHVVLRGDNLLRGVIKLQKLNSLDIGGDGVTDASLEVIAASTQLRQLWLLDCPTLTDDGVSQLRQLPKLEWLYLGNSTISGQTLSQLAACKSLTRLSLSDCNVLSDVGLAEIAKISSLRTLVLSNCHFITALGDLEPLTRLEELNVSGCDQLSNHALAQLQMVPHLKSITAHKTWVDDYVLAEWAEMPDLETLDLAGCWNTNGSGLVLSGGYAKLKNLDLTGCEIDDTSLEFLAQVPSLEQIVLRQCDAVSSEGLAALRRLPRLQYLTLTREESERSVQSDFNTPFSSGQLTVCGINLDDNDLAELARFESLQVLELVDCPLVTDSGLDALCQHANLPLGLADLSGTSVTPEGIARLKATFPQCNVLGGPFASPTISPAAPASENDSAESDAVEVE